MAAENGNTNEFDWDDPTGSGLLDRYQGVVTSSSFGIDEEYRDDTIQLMWDIEVTDLLGDPDATADVGDVLSEGFNAGKVTTLEVVDGGKRIARIDGKRVKFNENSGVGHLVALAVGSKMKTEEGVVELDGSDELKALLRERGGGDVAKIWEGLEFEFQRFSFSFTNDDDEKVIYRRVYPVRFVGEKDPS